MTHNGNESDDLNPKRDGRIARLHLSTSAERTVAGRRHGKTTRREEIDAFAHLRHHRENHDK